MASDRYVAHYFIKKLQFSSTASRRERRRGAAKAIFDGSSFLLRAQVLLRLLFFIRILDCHLSVRQHAKRSDRCPLSMDKFGVQQLPRGILVIWRTSICLERDRTRDFWMWRNSRMWLQCLRLSNSIHMLEFRHLPRPIFVSTLTSYTSLQLSVPSHISHTSHSFHKASFVFSPAHHTRAQHHGEPHSSREEAAEASQSGAQ